MSTSNKYSIENDYEKDASSQSTSGRFSIEENYGNDLVIEHQQLGPFAPSNRRVRINTTEITTYTIYPGGVSRRSLKYHPEVKELRMKRKLRTVVAGVVSGAVGLVLAGPLVGVIGGLAGAYGTKAVGQRKESRLKDDIMDDIMDEQPSWQQQQFVSQDGRACSKTFRYAEARSNDDTRSNRRKQKSGLEPFAVM